MRHQKIPRAYDVDRSLSRKALCLHAPHGENGSVGDESVDAMAGRAVLPILPVRAACPPLRERTHPPGEAACPATPDQVASSASTQTHVTLLCAHAIPALLLGLARNNNQPCIRNEPLWYVVLHMAGMRVRGDLTVSESEPAPAVEAQTVESQNEPHRSQE